MSDTVISPNFTISAAAKSALAGLKADMTRDSPKDPPAVAMVGWGMFYDKRTTKRAENVVVSFYPRSMLPEVEHGIRRVSGLPLVFFVTKETAGHFSRKILDFDPANWFFLRDP